MASVIHRTTLQLLTSVSTPTRVNDVFIWDGKYPVEDWIHNPNLSAVEFVSKKYWKIVIDNVLEMTVPEKAIVDLADLNALIADLKEQIKTVLRIEGPLQIGPNVLSSSAVATGLDITCNIDTILVDDVTTVIADLVLMKTVWVCYLYNSTSDTFGIEIFEKTDGLYSDFAEDEFLVKNFGEWTVAAEGTVLIPV